jgi:hypothetical protein
VIPKNSIPDGWIWFYWINPVAYCLKSITVNEYMASDYDFDVCVSYSSNVSCAKYERYGDLILESRGNPVDEGWIWYGAIILVCMYAVFLVVSSIVLSYIRIQATPPPPRYTDDDEDDSQVMNVLNAKHSTIKRSTSEDNFVERPTSGFPLSNPTLQAEGAVSPGVRSTVSTVEMPYDPVTFAFKDIWYTVKIKGGEELDLLRGVSGYFEPGTVTALVRNLSA